MRKHLSKEHWNKAVDEIRELCEAMNIDTYEGEMIFDWMEILEKAFIWMDSNGYKFDAEAWLADESKVHFAHDLFGILDHCDRETGELLDCFIPRYARAVE